MVGENKMPNRRKKGQEGRNENAVAADHLGSAEDLVPGHVDPLPVRRSVGADSLFQRTGAGVRHRPLDRAHCAGETDRRRISDSPARQRHLHQSQMPAERQLGGPAGRAADAPECSCGSAR